ncbi:MAG: DUF6029 family protein [Candidatus Krumholzibacteriia bacterium]
MHVLFRVCLLALLLAGAVASAAEFAAPDWTLPTPDGNSVNLHETLQKGPVVVSFWATWCIPCLKEMPHLNELAGEFAEQVSFIAVSVDNSKSMAKVGPLVRAKGWDNLTVVQDAGGQVQQILQVLSPPYVVVYDAAGREVFRHEGYRQGDEEELRHVIEDLLAEPEPAAGAAAPGGLAWSDAVTATDQFKYSYSLETDREIMENWLDVAYQFGDFRTGFMLNHQGPAEDGNRRNEIVHRYVTYHSGDFDVRLGHYYGLFGRGLVWNSYEDRFIRVDTALDGVIGRGAFGPVGVTVMSGTTGTTPTFNDPDFQVVNHVDVRGADVEYQPVAGLSVGASALTYLPQGNPLTGDARREWVTAGRAGYTHERGSLYLEYGDKTGYELDLDRARNGSAFYGNLGLFLGRLSVSVERSDYDRFTVLEGADGKQPLNRPPALVREHIYTLLGRKPHNMNQNNEKGWQIELNGDLGRGWVGLMNASTIETHDRETLYEEVYGHSSRSMSGPSACAPASAIRIPRAPCGRPSSPTPPGTRRRRGPDRPVRAPARAPRGARRVRPAVDEAGLNCPRAGPSTPSPRPITSTMPSSIPARSRAISFPAGRSPTACRGGAT